MATNRETIKDLEKIDKFLDKLKEDLDGLKDARNTLARHIGQQSRRPAWGIVKGKWKQKYKSVRT